MVGMNDCSTRYHQLFCLLLFFDITISTSTPELFKMAPMMSSYGKIKIKMTFCFSFHFWQSLSTRVDKKRANCPIIEYFFLKICHRSRSYYLNLIPII